MRSTSARVGLAGGCSLLTLLTLALAGACALTGADTTSVVGLHALALRHPLWVDAQRAVSDGGTTAAYMCVLSVLSLPFLRARRWHIPLTAAVIMQSSSLLNSFAKDLVGRPRPHLLHPVATAAGLSFPSGHAQAAVVGWTLIVGMIAARHPQYLRRASWLALVPILAIGFSRVALGVHYPSDVLAGYTLGGIWVAVARPILRTWRPPPTALTTAS